MAFRFYNDQGFAPLFRLLDDFDSYQSQQPRQNGRHRSIPTFQPRFDVRELQDSYELHGELPGMRKENVEIEFSDPHTMLIRGRIERTYQSGTPPAGLVEGTEMSGAITEKAEDSKQPSAHQATVEDEDAAAEVSTPTSETPAADVVKHDKKKPAAKDPAKYWVSERSIGEFSRSFTFPGHIDQQKVNATLNEGILTVVVPKAKKPETHRVTIN